MKKKRVLILGCTGSIGRSTLNIVKSNLDKFDVVGLSAYNNNTDLQNIANSFNCKNTYLAKDGVEGLISFIKKTEADICVNGIAGSAGLLPSVAALQSNKNLALANKETMVMAGPLIKNLAKSKKLDLLPVDSEHSAVFMLTNGFGKNNIDKIILTASGGPFRTYSKEQLKTVTLDDALKHPTWNMGKKITIDSATLANKGLEVIEACMLFDVSPQKVQVVVHPQSIIHSLIRTIDGVMYAQLSKPDMRHPIISALSYPDFIENNLEIFDFLNFDENGVTLSFFPPKNDVFPMLNFAYKAVEKGVGSQIAYNAANEVAVDNFIKGQINFSDISLVVEQVLEKNWQKLPNDFDEVFDIDRISRKFATDIIAKL